MTRPRKLLVVLALAAAGAAPALAAVKPAGGKWRGRTEAGGVVSFTVKSDGSAITRIAMRAKLRCDGGSTSTRTFKTSDRWRIRNGMAGSKQDRYIEFPSRTRARGRLRVRTYANGRSCDTGWLKVTARR